MTNNRDSQMSLVAAEMKNSQRRPPLRADVIFICVMY